MLHFTRQISKRRHAVLLLTECCTVYPRENTTYMIIFFREFPAKDKRNIAFIVLTYWKYDTIQSYTFIFSAQQTLRNFPSLQNFMYVTTCLFMFDKKREQSVFPDIYLIIVRRDSTERNIYKNDDGRNGDSWYDINNVCTSIHDVTLMTFQTGS